MPDVLEQIAECAERANASRPTAVEAARRRRGASRRVASRRRVLCLLLLLLGNVSRRRLSALGRKLMKARASSVLGANDSGASRGDRGRGTRRSSLSSEASGSSEVRSIIEVSGSRTVRVRSGRRARRNGSPIPRKRGISAARALRGGSTGVLRGGSTVQGGGAGGHGGGGVQGPDAERSSSETGSVRVSAARRRRRARRPSSYGASEHRCLACRGRGSRSGASRGRRGSGREPGAPRRSSEASSSRAGSIQ